jgi:hypothetical protein
MAHLIECRTYRDPRGMLTVVEDELPFAPARLFWITGADGHVRGGHGHKKTQMVLFAVAGTVKVNIRTGGDKRSFLLDRPDIGLYLAPEDWHTMEFAEGGVLFVAASLRFDPQDYIHMPPGASA